MSVSPPPGPPGIVPPPMPVVALPTLPPRAQPTMGVSDIGAGVQPQSPPASGLVVSYQSSLTMDMVQVSAVAKAQRLLIWVILLSLLSVVPMFMMQALVESTGGSPVAELLMVLTIIIVLLTAFVARIWAAVKLSNALGYGTGAAVAWGIGMALGGVIPLLGLILLLIINQRATGFLQRSGVRVGLMGAKLP